MFEPSKNRLRSENQCCNVLMHRSMVCLKRAYDPFPEWMQDWSKRQSERFRQSQTVAKRDSVGRP